MHQISSGIKSLDGVVDSFYIGDNVVWEADAGTAYEVFVCNFIRQSFDDSQKIVYVSFNKSPQSILNEANSFLKQEYFILIDCFTSGKGKNDNTFLKFYENQKNANIIRIKNPKNIEEFTQALNSIEDSFQPGVRYVFDSLTGMQDLWTNEDDTYRFFTYMCPRLYDLGTVAYWILEKEAHSQKFKANLRHITQVVFDLYARRDKLYIKALKLDARQNREAFNPHLYEITDKDIKIISPKKEFTADIGSKIKRLRLEFGMSQKDLADKIDLTPSFVSQLENNQISPSLSSFLQICSALEVKPGYFFEMKETETPLGVFRKELIFSSPAKVLEEGITYYKIISDEKLSAGLVVISPGKVLKKHFHYIRKPEFVYVLKGKVSLELDNSSEILSEGDSLYLKESFPSQWKNEGGDSAEVLLVC
jgi:transcriptional regulator with XRE-family HTH domain